MRFSYRRSATDEHSVDVDVVPHPDHPDLYRVTVGERVFELSRHLFQRAAVVQDGGDLLLQYAGREYRLYDASQRRRTPATRAGDLRAPMAGKVMRILVQPGEAIKAGATMIILEAMKMEQQITAPRDGVVSRLLCHEGEQVASGAELVVLDAAPADSENKQNVSQEK